MNCVGNIGIILCGELEVEYGNEIEVIDVLELEGWIILLIIIMIEFIILEVEYEKEYYDGMDLFGFGFDFFYFNFGLFRGENIYENGFIIFFIKI